MQTINVGAKRLGDESKIKQRIDGFDRTNFNLNRKWRSTMNVGTLVPCYKALMTAGTTVKLDEKTDVKTLPTVGPLFGSFKMQTDYFFVPLRLYISSLHNNQLGIGLNMDKVKLPKLMVENIDTLAAKTYAKGIPGVGQSWRTSNNVRKLGVNPSNVLHYLGYKGGLKNLDAVEQPDEYQWNKINVVPLLGMFDTFKNYYSNKQEEYCYITTSVFQIMGYYATDEEFNVLTAFNNYGYVDVKDITFKNEQRIPKDGKLELRIIQDPLFTPTREKVEENLQTILERVYIDIHMGYVLDGESVEYKNIDLWSVINTLGVGLTYEDIVSVEYTNTTPTTDQYELPKINQWAIKFSLSSGIGVQDQPYISRIAWRNNVTQMPIKLSIFDEIRENLLTKPFNQQYTFLWNSPKDSDKLIGRLGKLQNFTSPLEGLMVKTYQSDLLNNWMNTEWLDGENGINAVTAVDTSSGSFDINSLIVARKTFEMLTRITMSDGDYAGWQTAVYDHKGKWNIERPLYIGGFSEEIVFQEVVSNSAAENEPLGTLAGRGLNINKKGSEIYYKADEAGYLIGLTSITPRLDYSDGNDFDVSLDSIDDLHKPSLDGISFQDLNTKQAAWWDGNIQEVFSFGKQVAWQNYMTDINQVHGEFALNGEYDWMILQRKYQMNIENTSFFGVYKPTIKDRTTYINPNDWNGIFADERDDGQNFWVQKAQFVDMRRVMAGKQIPNL